MAAEGIRVVVRRDRNMTSIGVGRDHLAAVAAAKGLPDTQGHRLLDELDVTVTEQGVDTARMLASRRDVQ